MLDLKYYAIYLLSKQHANIIIGFFKDREFENINKAQWFFKQVDSSIIKNIEPNEQKRLLQVFHEFGEKLDSEQLSFEEKKELVLNKLTFDSPSLNFLEAKGTASVTCICPQCKDTREKAFMPQKGNAKVIKCNHRSSCGFFGDFISAYALEWNMNYGKAMITIADELGIDFTSDEVHIGSKLIKKAKVINEVKPRIEVINYLRFDPNHLYLEINHNDYIKRYNTMTKEQKFKMLATSIYNFSLKTKQTKKIEYFRKIGISSDTHLLNGKIKMINEKLGFLDKSDVSDLISELTDIYGIDDLIEFGVINPMKQDNGKPHRYPYGFKQSIEDGLIVIPNFDMYSNMCTGLKYRKTKLKHWIDKKTNTKKQDNNKEPEFSYGRIAKPLPYHLTRESLLNHNISFRFFEGQKDLHSMPSKYNVCDIAIPGVNGISIEMLGLFKGRNVKLYFDQDEAGQAGAIKLKNTLEKAGAIVMIKQWNIALGGDINDVLQNGYIEQII